MDEDMNNNDTSAIECSICCEVMDMSNEDSIYRTKCNHLYHANCIIQYAVTKFSKMQNLTCPLCRSIECNKNDESYHDIRQQMVAYGLINYTALNIASRPLQHEGNREEISSYEIHNSTCSIGRLVKYIVIILTLLLFAYIILSFIIFTR
jgi:hypothetical protein